MRGLSLLGAVAVVACVAGASHAVGSTPTPSLTVAGQITAFAADQGRAIVLVERGPTCADVLVWDHSSRKTTIVFDHRRCALAVEQSYGPVALAGNNAAYAGTSVGNFLESYVYVTSLATGKTSRVALEYAGDQGAYGRVVGDPEGHGRLLVYNDYLLCGAEPAVGRSGACPHGVQDGTIVSDQIHLALPSRRVIATASQELTVFSVGGGRVVVGTQAGALVVLAPTSKPAGLVRSNGLRAERVIAAFKYKPNEVDGAVTDGRTLAVRRSGAIDVIPLPGNHGGLGKRTLRVAADRLTDLDGNIAVYIRGHAIHLLDLTSGRSVVFARTTVEPAGAQLEPDGLYIASWRAIAFTPRAHVEQRLRR
jgi:hypothetical protein